MCWAKQVNNVVECIQQMQKVEKTLSLLIRKYDEQIREQKHQARQKMYNKNECMVHIKTIMVIKHHKKKLEQRLTACLNKRYHLESLNVTKMHLEAVRMTSKTFSRFLKDHDIERVEELKETLTTMIDDACEINDTLNETTVPYQVDTEEIEDEYKQMQLKLQLPGIPKQWTEIELVEKGVKQWTEIELTEEGAKQPLMKLAV